MMQTLSKYVNHASDSTLMHIILEGNGNDFENVEIITDVSDFIIYYWAIYLLILSTIWQLLIFYITFSSVPW